MKYFVLLLISFLSWNSLSGQTIAEYEKQITEAYVEDRMSLWRTALTGIENQYKQQPSDSLLLYLTISQYGYIGYLMGEEKEDKAEKLLEKAEDNAEALQNTQYCSKAYAVKAGLIGYRIGLNTYKAPFLGRKGQNYIGEAMDCDSLNPMAWMEKGNAYYHMPGMFGGNYEKAIRYYGKAVDLFENRQDEFPHWLYLNALVWHAKALAADGKTSRARKVYQKALDVAPGFKWVKEELLPGVED